MLVTSIQFGLFCFYPCLIFSCSVICACYFYPICFIWHFTFPFFSDATFFCFFFFSILVFLAFFFAFFLAINFFLLLLLSNLAYFAFILVLFLASQSSMLVTPIQFGLFCIYPCLIFSGSVIYACYFYPIWLILHLFLPYF